MGATSLLLTWAGCAAVLLALDSQLEHDEEVPQGVRASVRVLVAGPMVAVLSLAPFARLDPYWVLNGAGPRLVVMAGALAPYAAAAAMSSRAASPLHGRRRTLTLVVQLLGVGSMALALAPLLPVPSSLLAAIGVPLSAPETIAPLRLGARLPDATLGLPGSSPLVALTSGGIIEFRTAAAIGMGIVAAAVVAVFASRGRSHQVRASRWPQLHPVMAPVLSAGLVLGLAPLHQAIADPMSRYPLVTNVACDVGARWVARVPCAFPDQFVDVVEAVEADMGLAFRHPVAIHVLPPSGKPAPKVDPAQATVIRALGLPVPAPDPRPAGHASLGIDTVSYSPASKGPLRQDDMTAIAQRLAWALNDQRFGDPAQGWAATLPILRGQAHSAADSVAGRVEGFGTGTVAQHRAEGAIGWEVDALNSRSRGLRLVRHLRRHSPEQLRQLLLTGATSLWEPALPTAPAPTDPLWTGAAGVPPGARDVTAHGIAPTRLPFVLGAQLDPMEVLREFFTIAQAELWSWRDPDGRTCVTLAVRGNQGSSGLLQSWALALPAAHDPGFKTAGDEAFASSCDPGPKGTGDLRDAGTAAFLVAATEDAVLSRNEPADCVLEWLASADGYDSFDTRVTGVRDGRPVPTCPE